MYGRLSAPAGRGDWDCVRVYVNKKKEGQIERIYFTPHVEALIL